jgi:hypothetical protein
VAAGLLLSRECCVASFPSGDADRHGDDREGRGGRDRCWREDHVRGRRDPLRRIVSGGGQADLEGVELENGLIGIATAVGAPDSTFSDGVITNALKPFVVNTGSKLTVSRVKATTPADVPQDQLSRSRSTRSTRTEARS